MVMWRSFKKFAQNTRQHCYYSAGKHDRAFFFLYYYTPFTNYPHLLLTPIYYLPPFTIYPHLLFTAIYYLHSFTIYPLY